MVGVDNMVVVNTEDATLVIPKNKVEDIKKLVEQLKLNGQNELI